MELNALLPGAADPVSALSHGVGAVLAAGLGIRLLRRSRGPGPRFAVGLFVATALLLLTLSGLFHLLPHGSPSRAVLQRLDHAAIFALIAGSFTPVQVLVFTGGWRWGTVRLIWGLAATAIALKTWFFARIPEGLGLSLYLGFGWLGLASGIAVARRVGVPAVRPLLFSAAAYTGGALVDFGRWPSLIPGVLGPHELFHLAVLAGIGFHFQFLFGLLARAAPAGMPNDGGGLGWMFRRSEPRHDTTGGP